MKKITVLVILAAAFAATSVWAGEGGPCKDKREAKHSSMKALHECLRAWGKEAKPDAAEPTDDCSSKLQSFISSTKALKACRVEAKAKKEKK